MASRILPFGIVVGALTLAHILLKLYLISQSILLPGHLILANFILLVLYVTGVVETAIQLFGPSSSIDSKCQHYVFSNSYSGISINTLAWLEQDNICNCWLAAFSFWIIGTVLILHVISLSCFVAQRGYRAP